MIGSSLGNKQTNNVRPVVKITEVNHLIYGRLNLKPLACGAVYKEQISSKTNKTKITTTTIRNPQPINNPTLHKAGQSVNIYEAWTS